MGVNLGKMTARHDGHQRQLAQAKPGKHLFSMLLVVAFGVAVAIIIFSSIREIALQRAEERFLQNAREFASVLSRELQHEDEELHKLKSIFSIHPDLRRPEFNKYTDQILEYQPALRAIGWHPRVAQSEIDSFERAAQDEGLQGYRVRYSQQFDPIKTPLDITGQYPLLYIAPYEQNKNFTGFDLISDPRWEPMIELATQSSHSIVSERIQFGAEDVYGFFLIIAVYNTELQDQIASPESREHIRGILTGAYNINRLFEEVLGPFSDVATLYLFDTTTPDEERILYVSDDALFANLDKTSTQETLNSANDDSLNYRQDFSFGGRTWTLVAQPTELSLIHI